MEINLVELWSRMGLPVRLVVGVLTLQAIASLAVVIDRFITMARHRARSKAFSQRAAELAQTNDDQTLLEVATNTEGSYLATLVGEGLRAYFDKLHLGASHDKAIELTRRTLERTNERIAGDLQRGMNVLASTGSTAPFVGLLGTVLGILGAFKLIASNGSGGLGTIGGAIGEALIVTGYGLCVAIPTVLVFNWVNGKLAKEEASLENAAGELVDRLEAHGFGDEYEDEDSSDVEEHSEPVLSTRHRAERATA